MLAAGLAQAQLPAVTPFDEQLEARAAAPATLGPERSLVEGRYSGLVGCAGRIDRFTLDLRYGDRGQLAGEFQRQPLAGAGPRGEGAAAPQQVAGSYDAQTGVFLLGPAAGAARDPRATPLLVVGVFQNRADGLLMRPRVGETRWCEVLVARKGTELPRDWLAVADQPAPRGPGGSGWLILQIPEKLAHARDALRRRCEGPILPWLEQLRSLSDTTDLRRGVLMPNLFSDALFVPHFGKPFRQLSEGERMDYAVQLRGSCNVQRDDRMRDLAQVVPADIVTTFMNMPQAFSDADKVAGNIVFGELRRWRDHSLQLLAEVARQPHLPELADRWLEAAQPMQDLLLATERRAFADAAVAAKRSMGMAFLAQLIDRSAAKGPPTMGALEQLAHDTRAYLGRMKDLSEADRRQAQQRVLDFVLGDLSGAAERYAAAGSSVADAHQMAKWQEAFPLVWAMLPEPRRHDPSQRIVAGRTTLLGRLAAEEMQRHEALPLARASPLAALELLAAEDSRLSATYTTLLREAPFAAFEARRAAERQRQLLAGQAELGQSFATAVHLRQLKDLRRRYLIEPDLREGAGLRVLGDWQARARAVTPFLGFRAEDYLSALYTSDFDTVRELDRQRVLQVQQRAAAAGPLQSLIVGFSARLTLVQPMLAMYLGSYQSRERYRPCLKPSTPFDVETTTSEYKKHWGWQEISTRRQRFHVPTELAPLVPQVGLDTDAGFTRLLETFFRDHSPVTAADVMEGVDLMMKTMDCTSEPAKRMQAQMLRFWAER